MFMRKINFIIIHCADTEPDDAIDCSSIDRWHKQRGWKCVGYHFVIPTDGRLQHGRPVDCVGAHCLYYNKDSIGICYIGGRRQGKFADTRTDAQKLTMEKLVLNLLKRFPKAKLAGHRDFDPNKMCPCFNVVAWALSIGVAPYRIYRYAQ